MHIGIAGAGNISGTHVRAVQSLPGLTIAATFAPNIEKARRLAETANATAYAAFDAFLAHRPLDLILVGSPSGLHAEQAIAAAEQGVHSLVEKPLDISIARIDILIETAERRGVRVGVLFQDRLKPDMVRVKQMIDGGDLGTPVMASARVKWHRAPEYYSESRWRGTRALDGGGAVINQGIHTVDVLQWLFGPVESVSARVATRVHDIEAEDTAAAVLSFSSGAIGVLEAATSVYPGYSRRIELTGSEGTLVIEQDTLIATDLRGHQETSAAQVTATSAMTAAVADATPHARMIQDFVKAIETGRPSACDAREGRKSVAIVEAIYRSARTGQAEQVP
jgi:UDP-N-acetyl-2-amino-2-deoxyglucuronate dehydrogenase